MLTAIIKQTGEKVVAEETDKSFGPFFCPYCNQDAIVRKGAKVTHHFAHKANVDCVGSQGETKEHRKCKSEIYKTLIAKGFKAELEYNLGDARPDIATVINGVNVAIEVQRSNLSTESLKERTKKLNDHGYSVIWILITERPTKEKGYIYSPKGYIKDLHAMSHGYVYYWDEGLTVTPVTHFIWNRWVDGMYGEYIKPYKREVFGLLEDKVDISTFKSVTSQFMLFSHRNTGCDKVMKYGDLIKPNGGPYCLIHGIDFDHVKDYKEECAKKHEEECPCELEELEDLNKELKKWRYVFNKRYHPLGTVI